MNRRIFILLVLLITFSSACAQNEQGVYNRYEKKAMEYFNQQFAEHQINWTDLKGSFELFFETYEITQKMDKDTTKYFMIIDYLQHSTEKKVFLSAIELTKELEKHALNEDIAKNCLFKFFDYYMENKKIGNTPKNFHVIGTNISFLKKDVELAPPLYMGAMNIGRYEKELYKKAVVLLIYYLYNPE